MRVKVREYIYYAKRQTRQDGGVGGVAGAKPQPGGPVRGAEQAGQGQVPAGLATQAQGGQWEGAPTSNMFDALVTPPAPAGNGL